MKTQKLLLTLLILFLAPATIAQDIKIYVSDAVDFNNGPFFIYQYDEDGSNPQVYIDEELSWPQDIVFIPAENTVLVSNLNSNKITKYAGSTGEYLSDFAAIAGGPTRMKIGADGLLYVLQWSNTDNKVLRYQLDGTFVDEFTSVGVIQSIGMDWDSAGNFYVSSFAGGSVRKFDSSGNDMGLIINTQLNGPTNIWIDGSDHIFVFDWSAGDIEEFDATGTHVGTFISGLGQPEGVDFRANGNILVGNGTTSEVKEYLADGTFVANTVSSGSGGLDQPNAVILFDRSTLSVPDNNFNEVFVTPTFGDEFRFNPGLSAKYRTLEVYNISGALVQTMDVSRQNLMNVQGFSEGIYFIVGQVAGTKAVQKIVVKKR